MQQELETWCTRRERHLAEILKAFGESTDNSRQAARDQEARLLREVRAIIEGHKLWPAARAEEWMRQHREWWLTDDTGTAWQVASDGTILRIDPIELIVVREHRTSLEQIQVEDAIVLRFVPTHRDADGPR